MSGIYWPPRRVLAVVVRPRRVGRTRCSSRLWVDDVATAATVTRFDDFVVHCYR